MTLASLLDAEAVPFAVLHGRYGALLELVRKLIGVVPNCDPYLEIWPPAFRTYNVMVPNLLNLPLALWRVGMPADVVGLAMYASSRAAGCPYCSAHTCSFALRRGATPEKVAHALDPRGAFSARERAALEVARAVSLVPAQPFPSLAEHFTASEAEWIVLGVAMMGFLNKFMDALGVPLESSTIEEVRGVIAPSGWAPGRHGDTATPDRPPPRADTLRTRLAVLPYIPSALALDRKWIGDAPSGWPALGDYLRARTGHDFPVLSRLRHGRAARAIAVMLRENFDPATTRIGIAEKCRAGVIFAERVGNPALAGALQRLAAPSLPAPLAKLTEAASPSPAQVGPDTIESSRALAPPVIVELVTFLSVLQLVHRLQHYYGLTAARAVAAVA